MHNHGVAGHVAVNHRIIDVRVWSLGNVYQNLMIDRVHSVVRGHAALVDICAQASSLGDLRGAEMMSMSDW